MHSTIDKALNPSHLFRYIITISLLYAGEDEKRYIMSNHMKNNTKIIFLKMKVEVPTEYKGIKLQDDGYRFFWMKLIRAYDLPPRYTKEDIFAKKLEFPTSIQ